MKKGWLLVWIPVLLLINALLYLPPGFLDTVKRDRTMDMIPQQIEKSLLEHEQDYRKAVEAMETALEENRFRTHYYCDSGRLMSRNSHAPIVNLEETRKKLAKVLSEFMGCCGVSYNHIMVSTEEYFYYPEGCVIFRYVVEEDSEQYCWIDLVYSEQWAQHKAEKKIHTVFGEDLATELTENWCLVMLYPE